MNERNIGDGFYGARASDALAGGIGRMGEQVSDAADKATSKLDSVREPIADKLTGAADMLREQAERLPGEKVAGAVRSAADKLESSATYLVSHDAGEILQELVGVVKRHPAASLLIAAGLGFLFGRALRSN
jgi:hypothetical protein